jgi:hypothetical protein
VNVLHEARENIDALRSILGDGRVFAVIGPCACIAEGYRHADELASTSELFRVWSLYQGEREATAAR